MEGLECSEAKLSKLERSKRVDAEFFNPHGLHAVKRLQEIDAVSLASMVGVSDGNHFSISDEFVDDGVPYFRGQDVTGSFFMEQARPVTIPPEIFNQKHMVRSHLAKGDVLLSIVGTIGESALFSSSQPATCSCKLAILRPQSIPSEFLAVFLKAEYGRLQIVRQTRGAIQGSLLLEDMDQILVPRFSKDFEGGIVKMVRLAQSTLEKSASCQVQAEQTLLHALGLKNWQPPEPLTYSRRASEVFSETSRLDAEHWQEKFYAARRALKKAGAMEFIPIEGLLLSLTNGQTPLHHDLSVGEVPFLCAEHVTDFEVHYSSDKRVELEHHTGQLARTALRNGDILITIKGRVGNAAIVENVPVAVNINQDVALMRLNGRLPHWFVITYLNSYFGKLAVEQHCTGAINPFLGLSNIRRLLIPRFDQQLMEKVGEETRQQVQLARVARQQAQALLAKAKRAVEVAIEEGEGKAMDLLSRS